MEKSNHFLEDAGAPVLLKGIADFDDCDEGALDFVFRATTLTPVVQDVACLRLDD